MFLPQLSQASHHRQRPAYISGEILVQRPSVIHLLRARPPHPPILTLELILRYIARMGATLLRLHYLAEGQHYRLIENLCVQLRRS